MAKCKPKSYTSNTTSIKDIFTEFYNLIRRTFYASRNIKTETNSLIRELKKAGDLIQNVLGKPLIDLDMLEIGVGQLPRQMAYYSINNRVIGIDLDVSPRGFNIRDYWHLYQRNGLKRLVKTLGRKISGFDVSFNRELATQLGEDTLPPCQVVQMDASKMVFPSDTFDVVYSFNVFEHLPDPEAVIVENLRVLRPDGCIFIHFHLFTSDSGSHDVRIISGNRGKLPFWFHLRPNCKDIVQNAAYINKYQLSDWHTLFDRLLPGCIYHYWEGPCTEVERYELERLRGIGELSDFSDKDLMTTNLVVVWKK
jgi:SAM-dependent methyltransferase